MLIIEFARRIIYLFICFGNNFIARIHKNIREITNLFSVELWSRDICLSKNCN